MRCEGECYEVTTVFIDGVVILNEAYDILRLEAFDQTTPKLQGKGQLMNIESEFWTVVCQYVAGYVSRGSDYRWNICRVSMAWPTSISQTKPSQLLVIIGASQLDRLTKIQGWLPSLTLILIVAWYQIEASKGNVLIDKRANIRGVLWWAYRCLMTPKAQLIRRNPVEARWRRQGVGKC